MKQMMKYFGLTAMAVMGLLACTRAQVEQPVQKTITLTTTINLGEDEDSKALTALGVKTFAVGERVAVIHDCTNSNYTGKVVSEPLTDVDIYPYRQGCERASDGCGYLSRWQESQIYSDFTKRRPPRGPRLFSHNLSRFNGSGW